jgi:4-amino-4-deoxy-L-arabinose transferase-like glycosyltransferase
LAAVGLAALFIAVTCWWLSKYRGIPVWDAATHLGTAINTYDALSSGHLLRALNESTPYPPLTFLVGALGVLVGGVGVAPPIIALDVIFVLLLALGCYNVGRMAFGRPAGLLAVIFVLGSPLVIEGFHEFMLDAPEAAMVAVAVWAILATEHFSRPGISALAGVAVGLGMLSKETFAFFVAGVVLATAARGGRRAWRGVAVFVAVALVIALPWYLYELPTIHGLSGEALGASGAESNLALFSEIAPPRLSSANLQWYFWSFLNSQLYLPLFAFALVGGLWTIAGFARRRPTSPFAAELALGAFVAWAALTETYVHDNRYGLPIVVYLAVLGVGWVPLLPRPACAAMVIVLVLAALANTLGVGFGIGKRVTTGWGRMASEQWPGTLTVYENHGIWAGAPTRDGDVLGLLKALRRHGIQEVRLYSEQEGADAEFSLPGIEVLAQIAGLRFASNAIDPAKASRHYAFLIHGEAEPGFVIPPCTELRDGAGVWVRLGGPGSLATLNYCPAFD